MVDTTSIINDILTPTVLISGIGFLLFNFNTHYVSLTTKISSLDLEIFSFLSKEKLTELEKIRFNIIKRQMSSLITRCRLTKYAVFILYICMLFTILSVLTLCAEVAKVQFFIDNKFSLIFFVLAIAFLSVSIIVELYEMLFALSIFNRDFNHNYHGYTIDDK